MGIGFGAILFLVSLGYGLQDALLQNITTAGALTTLDVVPNEQDGKLLSGDVIETFRKIEGVESVETSYDFSARLKFGDTLSDGRAVVASPGFLDLEGLKIIAGKTFDKNNPQGIVISSSFGKVFGVSSDELVGKNVSFSLILPAQKNSDGKTQPQESIDENNFEIVGVVESEETEFWEMSEAVQISSGIPFARVKVKCKSSETIATVKDTIIAQGYTASSLSETVAEVNRMFRVVNIILGLFGIVTLVVSSIGMFNTMTVALLERTREIGIMRSIGASRMDILLMFVIESTLMGFFGGLTGMILGIASGQSVNLIVNLAAKYFGGKSLVLFAYPIWFMGFVLLFSIIIGFATGIGPAKRASSLDPLEALHSR
jgi:putative ABC transport system permease protein